ncbi:MAG: tripartite tricarboxylate transporter TctB family protein [Burkholderiales bacterium]|nr:tripartite tricarboxylate transporter TctB family protein [Burkholderiales bacterium]
MRARTAYRSSKLSPWYALAPGRLVAGMFMTLALVFGAASWKLGYWVHGEPGPGLLPLGTSLLLAVCAAFLYGPPREPEEAVVLERLPLVAFALLCAYGLALPWGGMVLPSVIFGVLWMRLLHQRPFLVSLIVSALVTGAGTLMFKVLLKVPMSLWPGMS